MTDNIKLNSLREELLFIRPYYKSLKQRYYFGIIKHFVLHKSLSVLAKSSIVIGILPLLLTSSQNMAESVKSDTICVGTIHSSLPIITIDENTNNFMKAIGVYESSDNYKSRRPNSQYLGKYQIGDVARTQIGLEGFNNAKGYKEFLKNEQLQDMAMYLLLKENFKFLRGYIPSNGSMYVGRYYVTTSGLLAMAHLVGANEVIRFITSEGRYIPTDSFGTKSTTYLMFNNHFLNLN